jgi:sugar phosphate isomerase/epimerase
MWRSGILSLAYLTVDGASPEEHVAAAAAAGFDAAGLRIRPPTHLKGQPELVGDTGSTKRLARVCRRHGIRPLDAEVMSLTAETSRDEMEAMTATTAALGFRFVQTVIEDEDLDRATRTLASLVNIAASAKLRVALEFMAFRPLSNLEAALRMLREVDAGNLGLLIDVLHLNRSGGSLEDLAALPPESIAMLQLCDAPSTPPGPGALIDEARRGRLHPGEGDLPLDALLDVLPDRLPISLEVPHPDYGDASFDTRASQAMHALRAFLDRRNSRKSAAPGSPAFGNDA